MSKGKAIIFSAPSGSGKSTVVNFLLDNHPELKFSISATSRAPRGKEVNGVDYHFFSVEEFKKHIEEDHFLEWEEVYADNFYGTLRSEVERIWSEGGVVVFDVDVVGGVNIKKIFGEQALSLFIMAPSLDELRSRLERRGTDSPEAIERRLAKAAQETEYSKQFDAVVINDNLSMALAEAERIVKKFLA